MSPAFSLSLADYLLIAGYLLLLLVISVIFRARRFSEMFGEQNKPSWLLLSASLLMISWSPMTDMMSMGLILDNGYSSLWMLRDRFWLAGVPAILFASMWARLRFTTDNQLLRLRYSGSSAVVMHVFRALFLALFVIPFFAAFIILALKKFFGLLYPEQTDLIPLLLSFGVILLVLKNSFHQKIRTDALSALICLAAPFLVCFFIFKAYGGAPELYRQVSAGFAQQTNLLPSLQPADGTSSVANFLVFICLQWWSVYIIDDSDPNAQRHLQAKSRFNAFKALFGPILISSLMFLLVSVIWDCGIIEYGRSSGGDTEAFYLEVALKYLPEGFRAVVVIAFLFSFITTLESIINWGAGLLTVDIVKTYLHKGGSDRLYRLLSLLMMLLVSIISLIFAFNSDSLLGLQKFIFSISAGVAPVFLLRWFWWRINAWTQISAMLSSLVYTLIFNYLYDTQPVFRQSIDQLCTAASLDLYPLKLIILTTLVVATWLCVMYSTPPDNKEQLERFFRQTGTGGLWPKDFGDNGYRLGRKIWLCLVFAVTYILPYLFVWQFKFGSIALGMVLLAAFLVLAVYVYRAMAILLEQ